MAQAHTAAGRGGGTNDMEARYSNARDEAAGGAGRFSEGRPGAPALVHSHDGLQECSHRGYPYRGVVDVDHPYSVFEKRSHARRHVLSRQAISEMASSLS